MQKVVGQDRCLVLAPDIGGLLWEDRFMVLDLGGLCDPTIARTLFANTQRLHEYVLQKRPAVITLHSVWARRAAFDWLAREGEYSAVVRWDSGDRDSPAGIFVRRDLLRDASWSSCGICWRT